MLFQRRLWACRNRMSRFFLPEVRLQPSSSDWPQTLFYSRPAAADIFLPTFVIFQPAFYSRLATDDILLLSVL